MAQKDDEVIDGPLAAATILNHMDEDNRERLIKAISDAAPQVAHKITELLFTFDDISSLTGNSAQALINAVDHKDLVLSLKTANPEVKNLIFSNMSQRKAQLVREDLLSLPKIKLTDVKDAQKRILKTLNNLRNSGQIKTQGKNDIWV